MEIVLCGENRQRIAHIKVKYIKTDCVHCVYIPAREKACISHFVFIYETQTFICIAVFFIQDNLLHRGVPQIYLWSVIQFIIVFLAGGNCRVMFPVVHIVCRNMPSAGVFIADKSETAVFIYCKSQLAVFIIWGHIVYQIVYHIVVALLYYCNGFQPYYSAQTIGHKDFVCVRVIGASVFQRL